MHAGDPTGDDFSGKGGFIKGYIPVYVLTFPSKEKVELKGESERGLVSLKFLMCAVLKNTRSHALMPMKTFRCKI